MKTQTKHRIIGGIVLLALIAIFLSLLFHNAMPSPSSSNATNASKPQVILQLPAQQQTAAAPINTQTQAPTPIQSAVATPGVPTQEQSAAATQGVPPQQQSAEATQSALPQAQQQVSATSIPSLATNTTENTVPPVSPPVSTPTLKAAETATSIGTCTANGVDCSSNHVTPMSVNSAAGVVKTAVVKTTATPASASIAPVKVTHAGTATAIQLEPKQPAPTQPAPTNVQSKIPVPSNNDIKGSFFAPKAWVIQLASFSEKQNAKQLINHLRKAGYEAYSRASLDRSGRLLIHVYVGPEIQHNKILKLQQRLRTEFHLNGIVRKYTV